VRLRIHESAVDADGGKQLPHTIVQLARDVSSLLMLQRRNAGVEYFQLQRLTVQLRKHLHLCAEQLGNNRNGNGPDYSSLAAL
jgi:hypothetical protein